MTLNLLPDIFDRPLRQFPSLFPGLLSQWPNFSDEDTLSQEFSSRGVRIYEEDGHLIVEIPLPGLNLKDIEVTLNKGVLFVKGTSIEQEADKKRKYYRSSKRNYSYSVVLPTQIDEKQEPQAEYTDGILTVKLQLARQGETKKIVVKTGKK